MITSSRPQTTSGSKINEVETIDSTVLGRRLKSISHSGLQKPLQSVYERSHELTELKSEISELKKIILQQNGEIKSELTEVKSKQSKTNKELNEIRTELDEIKRIISTPYARNASLPGAPLTVRNTMNWRTARLPAPARLPDSRRIESFPAKSKYNKDDRK